MTKVRAVGVAVLIGEDIAWGASSANIAASIANAINATIREAVAAERERVLAAVEDCYVGTDSTLHAALRDRVAAIRALPDPE